jgi:hypothetical protein
MRKPSARIDPRADVSGTVFEGKGCECFRTISNATSTESIGKGDSLRISFDIT